MVLIFLFSMVFIIFFCWRNVYLVLVLFGVLCMVNLKSLIIFFVMEVVIMCFVFWGLLVCLLCLNVGLFGLLNIKSGWIVRDRSWISWKNSVWMVGLELLWVVWIWNCYIEILIVSWNGCGFLVFLRVVKMSLVMEMCLLGLIFLYILLGVNISI